MTEEDEEESVFNIPHSLPSSAHTTAVATRTPSGPPKVNASKYLPAYGGMFELPGTRIQHNGLRDGIPFFPNPHTVWVGKPVRNRLIIKQPTSAQCLLVASYLQAASDRYETGKSFSLIRASGSSLYLDIATSIPCDRNPPEHIESTNYALVPYSYPIRGIKHCNNTSNHVIVSFAEGIKLIQLNSLYRIPPISSLDDDNETDNQHCSEDSNIEPTVISDRPAISFVGSFPAIRGIEVIDASISTNQNLLNIANCDREDIRIKIYDLSRPKQCLSIISKNRDDEATIRLSMNSSLARKRTLRSFVPHELALEKLHQIECNPSHLINSVITTSTRVSQIDPRTDVIVEDYVNKFKLANSMPTEQFKRIEFSRKNDYQFYLMTNEKVRVFDRRFRSKDMNILDHMLNSATYEMMTMQLVPSDSSDIETLCLSSHGRLCFVSFDQSHHTHSLIDSAGPLVNPMSLHQPIHEPGPMESSGRISDQLYGLAVASSNIFDSDDVLFSTLQLSPTGKVCVRGFPKARSRNIPDNRTTRLRSENFRTLEPTLDENNTDIDPAEYRKLGADKRFIDRYDSTGRILVESLPQSGCQTRSHSKRATAKSESMRKFLGR